MNNQQYQPPPQYPQNPGQGLGIASMVLGILAVVFVWASGLLFPIAMAIVGLVLGLIAAKKSKMAGMSTGMATAGIVCSIVALGLNILCFICVCVAAAEVVSFGNSLSRLF